MRLTVLQLNIRVNTVESQFHAIPSYNASMVAGLTLSSTVIASNLLNSGSFAWSLAATLDPVVKC